MKKNPIKYVTVNENEKLEAAKQHARDKQMAKTKLYAKAKAKVKPLMKVCQQIDLVLKSSRHTQVLCSHTI